MDWDTQGMVLSSTGTQRDGDTMELERNGIEKQKADPVATRTKVLRQNGGVCVCVWGGGLRWSYLNHETTSIPTCRFPSLSCRPDSRRTVCTFVDGCQHGTTQEHQRTRNLATSVWSTPAAPSWARVSASGQVQHEVVVLPLMPVAISVSRSLLELQ